MKLRIQLQSFSAKMVFSFNVAFIPIGMSQIFLCAVVVLVAFCYIIHYTCQHNKQTAEIQQLTNILDGYEHNVLKMVRTSQYFKLWYLGWKCKTSIQHNQYVKQELEKFSNALENKNIWAVLCQIVCNNSQKKKIQQLKNLIEVCEEDKRDSRLFKYKRNESLHEKEIRRLVSDSVLYVSEVRNLQYKIWEFNPYLYPLWVYVWDCHVCSTNVHC